MEDDLNSWNSAKLACKHLNCSKQNKMLIRWKMTSMEEDLNGRRPQWKKTSIEDGLHGRQPPWKTKLTKLTFQDFVCII
jgi:hypothetical protein